MQINFQTNNPIVGIAMMIVLLPLVFIALIIAGIMATAKPAAFFCMNALMFIAFPLASLGERLAWRVLPDPSTLDAPAEAEAA